MFKFNEKQSVFDRMNIIQGTAVKKISSDISKNKRALLFMATGTGKTKTAFKFLKHNKHFKNILWITGSIDLINDAYRTALTFDYSEKQIGIFSGSKKQNKCELTLATIQSLTRLNNLKIFKKNQFDIIIVDECHHAATVSYVRVLEKFKHVPKLGLSATPYRTDGDFLNLDKYFNLNSPAFIYTYNDGVRDGILAKPDAEKIITNSVIYGMVSHNKEFTKKQYDKLYVSVNRNYIIVDSYAKLKLNKKITNPKAICFCINIEHAKRMAELFKETLKIKCDYICGDKKYTSIEKREKLINDFKTGDLEMLCAVNILNEGVDLPSANILLLARPTTSDIVFSQQIGRGSRTNGDKNKICYILDYVDLCEKQFKTYSSSNLLTGDIGVNINKINVSYIKDDADLKVLVRKTITNLETLIPKTQLQRKEEIFKEMIRQKDKKKFIQQIKKKRDKEAVLKFVKNSLNSKAKGFNNG